MRFGSQRPALVSLARSRKVSVDQESISRAKALSWFLAWKLARATATASGSRSSSSVAARQMAADQSVVWLCARIASSSCSANGPSDSPSRPYQWPCHAIGTPGGAGGIWNSTTRPAGCWTTWTSNASIRRSSEQRFPASGGSDLNWIFAETAADNRAVAVPHAEHQPAVALVLQVCFVGQRRDVFAQLAEIIASLGLFLPTLPFRFVWQPAQVVEQRQEFMLVTRYFPRSSGAAVAGHGLARGFWFCCFRFSICSKSGMANSSKAKAGVLWIMTTSTLCTVFLSRVGTETPPLYCFIFISRIRKSENSGVTRLNSFTQSAVFRGQKSPVT